ncbi:hypothetical protein VZ95_12360 [Elstera litoralis]|uniref:HTH tetR-type domain-containing protein n=1 Tax=Elstera litoralis TaxID=552518 RepID=A0A0F3IUM1_9PROT|nr:TetR/AcrR family transcriptional regulator [Elstera litoralis]KJV09294.1 hypothetical protein VZ95_12360 [Elstera litoralis]
MTLKTPRYHHGDLRGALIAAGRAILEEGGPSALSLREAARRAGVSHAAPRHHFPSLQHFLGDCAADGFDEFTEALTVAAASGQSPAEALVAMGRAYVRFAEANRAMFRLMFNRDTVGEHSQALLAAATRAYSTLVEAVRAVDTTVSQDELNYRIASIWSIVHGYAHLSLEEKIWVGPNGPASADLAARAVQDYLRGILA